MPLVPFQTEQITLDVQDRVYAGTTIKQKATFTRLAHTQSANTSNVAIDVRVSMYADDRGAYGPELSGPGFQPYNRQLGADNDTLVNAQTGAILQVRKTGAGRESDDIWMAVAELHPEAVMFQADFFLMLRDTQPIKIGDMIRQHITQADALGRFQ